ncbi:hypothetical protein K501DRAFT_270551 [Backusella circina FSU 941]|nr:hypothetical protein K501DRAFT_270551 [Backusella circina FSU 941]
MHSCGNSDEESACISTIFLNTFISITACVHLTIWRKIENESEKRNSDDKDGEENEEEKEEEEEEEETGFYALRHEFPCLNSVIVQSSSFFLRSSSVSKDNLEVLMHSFI